MASGQAKISVDVSPDDAWKLLRGFGTLAEWNPAIESCTVEGDVRTLKMMGIEVKEQLRELDDGARRIAYSVIESPMDNLESHLATISVGPDGAGSCITYAVEVSPDDMLGLFLPMYEGALGTIKAHLEA